MQELVHAHAHERADGVHDHLGAEFGIIAALGATEDQGLVTALVLGELFEGRLQQPRLLLDHGEHRRGIIDRVEELEATDRQLDEVVEEVSALRGELLLESFLAGIDRREAEDRVLLALEVVEERAPRDSDLGA